MFRDATLPLLGGFPLILTLKVGPRDLSRSVEKIVGYIGGGGCFFDFLRIIGRTEYLNIPVDSS